jgi:hypothetical protein
VDQGRALRSLGTLRGAREDVNGIAFGLDWDCLRRQSIYEISTGHFPWENEYMFPVNLNDLSPANIQALIDSEVAESLTLEYKRDLPSGQSEKKREFLYDVAAMANALGGDIVFGILDRRGEDNQSTGVADGLSGIKLANAQAEINRLSNLIGDSIAPRVAGIQMVPATSPQGDVLVLRVPRSWNKPHMVTIGGVNKFFGRVGTTKYLMSVDEIGRSFSEQRELRESIERWRSHRAELVKRGEGPVGPPGPVTMLFHAIPTSAFTRDVLRETWTVSEQEKNFMHVPNRPTNFRYNADGFLSLAVAGRQAYGYTQLFRSGIVEYADAYCYSPPMQGYDSMISGQKLEQEMVNCYKDVLRRIRAQGRSELLYVGFSLIGIANKSFYSTLRSLAIPDQYSILQDIFTSPEVFADMNDPEELPYNRTLLPLVDTMWQVAGRSGTPFKLKGRWDPFGEFQ